MHPSKMKLSSFIFSSFEVIISTMAQSLLQKFFPPPKFLKMPVTGLDISDGSVHVAEIGRASCRERV